MTIEEIGNKVKIDKYITVKKEKIIDQQDKKLMVLWNFDVRRTGGETRSAKKNIKRLPYRSSRYSEDESFNAI